MGSRNVEPVQRRSSETSACRHHLDNKLSGDNRGNRGHGGWQ